MTPIHIPAEWDDRGLITFEEFCQLLHLPPRTVRDWRRRRIGPRWARFNGTGRLYITVAEARRFLASATHNPTTADTPSRETGARHD